jgi:hypothetical protein
MSKSPLTEDERADLVAYLDGELSGEAARAIEARISLDPAVRAEVDSLKRAWDMLDFLPRPEPTVTFTERTLSKLIPVTKQEEGERQSSQRWRRVAVGVGWAAGLLLCGWIGYRGYLWMNPREAGTAELVRDLRLIENKPFYDLVEDIEFLKQLDHPDLFGEETGH